VALRIHQIVTGELESSLDVSLLGSGASPDLTREEVLPYGYRYDIRRRDGTEVEGAMVPVPVWLIEGTKQLTLIDSGLGDLDAVQDMQARYGIDFVASRRDDQDLVAGLAAHGVGREDVEVVALTHLHFDHVGGVELFPNARFVVQRDEVPYGLCPPRWATFYYPEDARRLHAVSNRFDVIDGDLVLEPGLRLVKVGGHTPGCMATMVDTGAGRVCLTSDLAYNYRNIELDWPPGSFWDLEALMDGLRRLRSEADIVVPQHDWRFREEFPTGTIG
jgi:glyoxylase-like metal-dependent hydrolase (beta-lactamase superfamily II)